MEAVQVKLPHWVVAVRHDVVAAGDGGAVVEGLAHRAGDRIVQINGGAGIGAGGHLGDVLMLGVVGERGAVGAIHNRRGHVERGDSDTASTARRHVAVGVIGEGGIGDAVIGANDGGRWEYVSCRRIS